MLYLLSSLPSHCCIWRVWSLWQVLPPWHEPNMVHVRLPFLQPGLCDVRSCSLLFVGALEELQYFIWNLEWIEWGKFRCKVARVFIFGPTTLSCIKRGRVCYKSISPSGDFWYIYGLRFHWKSHWLEAVTLALGDLPVFASDLHSPAPNKIY